MPVIDQRFDPFILIIVDSFSNPIPCWLYIPVRISPRFIPTESTLKQFRASFNIFLVSLSDIPKTRYLSTWDSVVKTGATPLFPHVDHHRGRRSTPRGACHVTLSVVRFVSILTGLTIEWDLLRYFVKIKGWQISRWCIIVLMPSVHYRIFLSVHDKIEYIRI